MEITCISINEHNESLTDKKINVKYLLPKEKANISDLKQFIIHEKDVVLKSSDRIKVKCPIFYECGGCDYLHMSYDAQCQTKVDYVKTLFDQYQLKTTFLPMIKSDYPYHYRHKVVASATTHKKRLAFGLYRENTRHVIPFTNCFIQDKDTNEVIKELETLLNQFKIPAYDIDKNQGIVKHVLIRKSYTHQSMLVCIVTNGNLLPNAKKIAQILVSKFPKVETVVQNIHQKKTHLVLLDQEKTIYGSGYILDQIEGISFRLSARSFYQVNPMQMMKLYHKAIEAANIKPHEIVLDTYSGIGTLALLMAKYAKKVIGVEVNKFAYLDA
ncbi:MAG: 23S rRNA (uracil(1939)-C(5))-methyltransferase RlmD, partial [Tenericutes bacterium HGW-Tenericutes-6]